MITNLDHTVSGPGEQRGVSICYGYGESNLVRDSLTSGLMSGPKFKIGKVVVQFVAINVMNLFGLQKRASKRFFHYSVRYSPPQVA